MSAQDWRAAGEIADGAHSRVRNLINDLIVDEKTPTEAIPVLESVFDHFSNKATDRINEAYRDLDRERRANRGV